MEPEILITEEMDAPGVLHLAGKYSVHRDATLWKSRAVLLELLHSARAILVRNQTEVNAQLLEAAPALAVIGRVGVGLDNIDLAAASNLGIVVVAPLEANATSVAEFTFGLLLALARKISIADRLTRAGGWNRKAGTGIELEGKTLAVCGYGRVGRKVAERARAFGLRLRLFDPCLPPEVIADLPQDFILAQNLRGAVAGADFVTVHCPLTPETRRMFDAEAFACFKPGALFINTSRGGVVDEPALLEALRRGHVGGAALDVRAVEPPAPGSGFESMDNVLLTPHIAAYTHEAQTRAQEAVAADVRRILENQPALHYLNFPRPHRRHHAS